MVRKTFYIGIVVKLAVIQKAHVIKEKTKLEFY